MTYKQIVYNYKQLRYRSSFFCRSQLVKKQLKKEEKCGKIRYKYILEKVMLTYAYIRAVKFGLVEKPKPRVQHERDVR